MKGPSSLFLDKGPPQMELLNCLYSMLQICASSSSFFFLEVVAEIAEFGERWRNDGGVSEAEIIKAKK